MKGGNPLVGEVNISGAKNAALGILAASVMTNDNVVIENLPDVNDINVMLEAISEIGAMVQRIDRHTVKINGGTIGNFNIEYDYIKKIRASYYLLGALLGKYKHAEVALPGGCNIGSRPIDQHLKGFRALGADVDRGRCGAATRHTSLFRCRERGRYDQRDDGGGHVRGTYHHGKCGERAACRGCGKLPQQHGREYPRSRN